MSRLGLMFFFILLIYIYIIQFLNLINNVFKTLYYIGIVNIITLIFSRSVLEACIKK